MKKIICLVLVSFTSIHINIRAQSPGQPYYPETANGASNVYFQYHPLKWQNPDGTVYNEVYIDFDSSRVANMDPSSLYVSGYPSTAFDSIRINQQLYYPARYFWCVVEYNSDSFTQGDTWYFTTTIDEIDFNILDDFSSGLGKWVIDNTTGCGWQLGEESDYTLPDPSTGKVLTANASLCASPVNATAYFQQVNEVEYMAGADLEFNSDWKTDNPDDFARVDMSTDGGLSWLTIWQRTGESDRNKHIDTVLFYENGIYDTIHSVQVRFTTLQNGTNSWWAIDDFGITAYDGILTHIHPYITSLNVLYENQPRAIVRWQQIQPVIANVVERKEGIPTSNNEYQIIATMPGSYTMTYIDSTVNDSSIYTYKIGYHESFLYVFSNEATAYVFPPIPVELKSFTGDVIDGNILLNWTTATEMNNQGFEIQRNQKSPSGSLQGNVNNQNWKKIGFVQGFGTTAEQHSYTFTDEHLLSGKYQYRLKQIDFDGTFEYSNVVDVEVRHPDDFRLSQNYPNPFNPNTNIEYQIPYPGFVTLKVYDALGNEVAELVNAEKSAGSYLVEFNGGKLASGIYFYQLKAGSYTATKKLLLLK